MSANDLRSRRLFLVPILLLSLTLTGCRKVELLSNLPEKEVNEVMSIMQKRKIPVSKKPGVELTWTVMLNDAADFSRAVEILASEGYPNAQYNSIGQVFQKSGLVSSPLEERARFMYALSENISETLNQIPGVLRSRVHIVLPENDPYSDADIPSSAAIFLLYKAGSSIEESVREIKYLVANSVQGLDYDRVSIALFPVSFDAGLASDGTFDPNVVTFGMSMSKQAATKFVTLMTVMGVLLLCSIAVAAFFFLSYKKNKRSNDESMNKPAAQPQNVPVAVQTQEESISELDEGPEET